MQKNKINFGFFKYENELNYKENYSTKVNHAFRSLRSLRLFFIGN